MAMTQEEFDARLAELRIEAKTVTDGWCYVVRCPDPDCKSENAWYEGLLSYLLERVNQPCWLCKKSPRTLHLGIGRSYEL